MTTTLDNNQWQIANGQIAAKFRLKDFKGMFTKTIYVERGTRALIYDGTSVKTVPHGPFALQTLFDTVFRDVAERDITVVLGVEDNLSIQFTFGNLLSKESLIVRIETNLTVKLGDLAMFDKNLLGTRDSLSIDELKVKLTPIFQQGVSQAVGQMSIFEITSPTSQGLILAALQQASEDALKKCGIEITGLALLDVANEQYDAHLKKTVDIFLMRQGIEQQKAIDEVERYARLCKIKAEEKLNDLLALAAHIQLDKEESEVALQIRRFGIRKNARDAVQMDEFNTLKTVAERERFLLELDKANMLRQDERENLVESIRRAKEDSELARAFLLRKLEVQQEGELESLRISIDAARERQVLQAKVDLFSLTRTQAEQEIELAELNGKLKWITSDTLRKIQEADADTLRKIKKADVEVEREIEKWKRDDGWVVLQRQIDTIEKLNEIDGRRMQLESDISINEERAKTANIVDVKKADAEIKRADKTVELDAERQKNEVQRQADESRVQMAASHAAQVAGMAAKHADNMKEITMATLPGVKNSPPTIIVAGANGIVNSATDATRQNEPVIVCRKCKYHNPPTSKHCSECGEALR